MNDPDFVSDENFQMIIEEFRNDTIIGHGFTFKEANAFVCDQLKDEFDYRIRSRRASFKVIEGGRTPPGP